MMGVQDSVKVIMFQAYDSQNNPVSHPFNFKSLKLSKHYGLSFVYNLWTFPNLSSSYEICGKTVPRIGIQPLRAIDIFNYDIGMNFTTMMFTRTLIIMAIIPIANIWKRLFLNQWQRIAPV